jgi:hypothetical protein
MGWPHGAIVGIALGVIVAVWVAVMLGVVAVGRLVVGDGRGRVALFVGIAVCVGVSCGTAVRVGDGISVCVADGVAIVGVCVGRVVLVSLGMSDAVWVGATVSETLLTTSWGVSVAIASVAVGLTDVSKYADKPTLTIKSRISSADKISLR